MGDFVETSASSAARLELSGEVPGTPDDAYAAFVDPGRITSWWPDEAEIDARVGGTYILQWPAMEWTLRGVYTKLDPGGVVAFTWSWDHEPDVPERTVRVELSAADDGTRIVLTHGEYTPEDAEERQGHLDGWQFFLGRLRTAFDDD